jgi:Fic family protein
MKTENVKISELIHTPLELFEPSFGSSLAKIILQLEPLRSKILGGTVPPNVFFQLKDIFQMLESLESARIEGNRTTLAEFVEKVIESPGKQTNEEQLREIFNIDKAFGFIEEHITSGGNIQRRHISEIHKMLTEGLSLPPAGEGSRYPGEYRKISVGIKGSRHAPPDPVHVQNYMDELIEFINREVDPQYDLLVTALSHHRLSWIHPFDNGNGRVVRMLTYAMLIKQGFQVGSGRILNPTAIFCMDRSKYYQMLELADSGEKDKALEWCEYVLSGLREELGKIDKLADRDYLLKAILLPAITFSFEREIITRLEFEILKSVVNSQYMIIKSGDIESIKGLESSVQRSRVIKRLREKRMLVPLKENGRLYAIKFSNNYLLRGIISALEQNKFIPNSLNEK